MSSLEILAVILSLVAVSLTIMRNMWCWLFNFIACAFYAYLFFEYKLYGETILQFIFMGLTVYGFYSWFKGEKVHHVIKIEPIATFAVIFQMLLATIGGLILGLLLQKFTDAALPILDSQLAAFSLLATYWTSRKHIVTWVLWVFVDIAYVGMFYYKDLDLTAALYAAFVVLAGFGWWKWTKAWKEQNISKLIL